MRVVIQSVVPEIEGEETIITVDSASVDSLIQGFCVERRLPPDLAKSLVIRLSPGQRALPHRKQLTHVGVADGSIVVLDRDDPFRLTRCSSWCFLSILALLIGITGLVLVCLIYAQANHYTNDYVVVINADSSETRLLVYEWEGNKFESTGIVKPNNEKICEKHGFSWYSNDTGAAGEIISHCLEFAAAAIPQADWSSTPVFLGATDGMRLLARTNFSAANTLLSAIRDRIQNDFTFQQQNLTDSVRILPGYEQAFNTWVSVNYATDRFVRSYPRESIVAGLPPGRSTIQWPPPMPSGVLQLSNVSAEAGYAVPSGSMMHNSSHITTTRIFGQNYTAFSHGMLCYGYTEAERRFHAVLVAQLPSINQTTNATVRQVQNPCAPRSSSRLRTFANLYGPTQFCTQNINVTTAWAPSFEFVGTSNVRDCESNLTKFFDMLVPCADGSTIKNECSLKTMWKPPIVPDANFTALSGYYETMLFFNFNRSSVAAEKPIARSRTAQSFAVANKKLPEFFVVNRSLFIEQLKMFCALDWLQAQTYNPHAPNGMAEDLASNCFRGQFVLRILNDGYGFDSDIKWSRITFRANSLLTKADDFDWPLGYALMTSNTVPAKQPNYVMPTSIFVCLLVLFFVCLLVASGFAVKARREQLRTAEYERFPTPDDVDES